MVTQKYNLNMVPGGMPVRVPVSQWDKGSRDITFTLYAGATLFEIPSGAAVRIDGRKEDGTCFTYNTPGSGSTATVTLTEQMTACPGQTECQIVITSGEKVIGSANFILAVEKDPLPANADLSATELSVLRIGIEAAVSMAASATESAATATNKAKAAASSATKAANSATAAASSESNAAASETNAASSATAAATSAESAAESASKASKLANSVEVAETNAVTAANNASWYASEAKASAEAAAESAKQAEGLPTVTTDDAGKFLRVSSGGTWEAESVTAAEGVSF